MPELLDLATKVVGWARDGEQVEAYAAHARDADVDVYRGDIETLSTAESDGVGIRVVLPGPDGNRQGFAYTGNLSEDALHACLEEARDNAAFGTPDPYLGLAEPDGVEPPSLDLWRESLASFPTSKKIDLAMELERKVREGDPRIRSLRSAGYGDGLLEVAIVSTTGISRWYRRTGCSIGAQAIAGPTTTRRPATATRSAAPRRTCPWTRRRRWPSSAPPGCWVPRSRRRRGSPSCSTRT